MFLKASMILAAGLQLNPADEVRTRGIFPQTPTAEDTVNPAPVPGRPLGPPTGNLTDPAPSRVSTSPGSSTGSAPSSSLTPFAPDSLTRAETPGAVWAVFVGNEGQLEVAPPRLEAARIQIDGRLNDPAWAEAALLTGFTQYEPTEGIPATQRTEVRVLVSQEAVFFGVHAFDSEEGGVRATLSRRDGFGRSDDYVQFVLDTFDDQRRAFVFRVNPLGIQGDGLWVGGGGWRSIDWNPDFLWESAGRVDGSGYSVELKIPLKSLRFPEKEVQDWGLQVVRRIQRNGFEESWAPISGEGANKLSQAGKLTGLRGLNAGRFLEFNPVMTATRQGVLDPDLGSLDYSPASGDFGFNATYGLTSNLTLDATFNPDFSQVEADAGQIAVNERFALYFPEKRAFFLEGTDAFSMPRQLVYTRSIGNPVGAAKLSGKIGRFTVAYIGAVDEVGYTSENPVVNLVRVKGDVGRSSTVGMVYTDRSVFGESFNRVVGADARLVLGGRYTLNLMASGSADGGRGRPTDWGSLLVASFSRSSRSLSLSASFEDISEEFRAGSGFIRRVGVTQLEGRTGYTWRGAPGALVESWGPSFQVQGYWDRSDFWSGSGPKESEVDVGLGFSLRGNIGGSVSLSRDTYSFGVGDYEGLFVAGAEDEAPTPFAPNPARFEGLLSLRARAFISSWERARISIGGSTGETPIFTSGVPADVAHNRSGDVSLTLYPSGSFSMNLGLRHVSFYRKGDGSLYSKATIPRFQARYQFSRSLYVRGIGEYASQSRGDILDPATGRTLLRCSESCSPRAGSESHDLRLEGLLGYEPSPGTVVYLGWSRQMRDAEAFGFRNFTPQADGLFVKVSYRFRM